MSADPLYGINQQSQGQRYNSSNAANYIPFSNNYSIQVEQIFEGSITTAAGRDGNFYGDVTVLYDDQGKASVPFGYGTISGQFFSDDGGQVPIPNYAFGTLTQSSMSFFLKQFTISIVVDFAFPITVFYKVYLLGQPQLIG